MYCKGNNLNNIFISFPLYFFLSDINPPSYFLYRHTIMAVFLQTWMNKSFNKKETLPTVTDLSIKHFDSIGLKSTIS